MAIEQTPDGPVQMDPAVMSAVRTRDDVALRTAWQRYLEYSTASDKRKRTQELVREVVIVLSVAVVVLAVISTYLSIEQARVELLVGSSGATAFSAEAQAEVMDGLCAVFRSASPESCLRSLNSLIEVNKVILIALPLIIAGTLTWMMQFMPGTAWIGYRIGAELVRYHLYLYRMEAGDFNGKGPSEQQALLLERVKQARRRVDQLGSSEPYTLPSPPDLAIAAKAKCHDERDDGFSPLTVDEYLLYRIRPQREWYVRKLHRNYNDLRSWRAGVLIVTGLGAFLVAIGLEPWVAVTTSLATAAGIYIDLKMYGRTYAIYHTAVMELDEETARWLAMPQDRKDETSEISEFVKTIEDIFQRERERWMQQATQSQTASEQTLLRNVNLANSPFRVADGINADNAAMPAMTSTSTAATQMQAQSQSVRATTTTTAAATAASAASALTPAAIAELAARSGVPIDLSLPMASLSATPRTTTQTSAQTTPRPTVVRSTTAAAPVNGSASAPAAQTEPAQAAVGRAATRSAAPSVPPEVDVTTK